MKQSRVARTPVLGVRSSSFGNAANLKDGGLPRVPERESREEPQTSKPEVCATLAAYLRVRSFGVRQLAAALLPASSLAANCARIRNPREQARVEESGSKLPHSKASHRMPPLKRSTAGV